MPDTDAEASSCNEDGNTVMTVINTATGAMKSYTADVAVLPHGGGLDDLKVINGVVYSDAPHNYVGAICMYAN